MKLLIPAVLAGLTTAAFADESSHEINQAGKKFSERRITVAVGETVKFVNDDGTTHNVHSLSEGNAFDLGAQAPGTVTTHTFTTAGKAKVRCAIHPKMKLDVEVVE